MENEQNNYESGISLKELWIIAKNNMLLIMLITFILTLGGAVYGLHFKETTYKVSATGIVMATEKVQSSQEYAYSTALIKTYQDFILSDAVLIDCNNRLKEANPTLYGNLTTEQIKKATSVTSTDSSLILKITVNSSSQDFCVDVANQLVDSAIAVAETVKSVTTNPDGSEVITYKYSVLANKFVEMNAATADKVVGTRGAGKVIIICFLAGLVLSYGFALIKFLVDDTFRSKKQFEEMTGLRVVSIIPDSKKVENEKRKHRHKSNKK